MINDVSRYDNQRPRFSPMSSGVETAGNTQDMDCESDSSASSASSSDDAYLQVTLVHPEYVDCSRIIPEDATQEEVDIAIKCAREGTDPDPEENGGTSSRKSSCSNKATFPTTLFDILADPDLDEIISWLPHGRSWRVVDSTKFNEQVLSSYFNQTKYTSFIRQVNGWGFRRVQGGPEYNTYYHELFLRGKPGLLKYMRRQPARLSNTTVQRGKKEVEGTHPDFYEIAESYPLPLNSPKKARQLMREAGEKATKRPRKRRPGSGKKSPKSSRRSKKKGPSSPSEMLVVPQVPTSNTSTCIQDDTPQEVAPAPFPWHQTVDEAVDALSFLDDPEVQMHGTQNFLSNVWDTHAHHHQREDGMHPGSPHSSGHVEPTNIAFQQQFQQQQQYQHGSAIFPSETHHPHVPTSLHQSEPNLHVPASLQHFHHQQESFHLSYSSSTTVSSSVSTMVSEPPTFKQEQGEGHAAGQEDTDANRQNSSRGGQPIPADQMLPMLQCLFE